MELLVDTYNVLHVTGALPPELAGPDVPALADLLAQSRWRRNPVILVCDGTPPPGQQGYGWSGVRVVYSGHQRSADDVIEQLIDASTAPRRLLVVSSDRRIQRAGRRRGCQILDSHTFLIRIAGDVQQMVARRPAAGPAIPHKSTKEWAEDLGVPLDASTHDLVDPDGLPPMPHLRPVPPPTPTPTPTLKKPTPRRAAPPPPQDPLLPSDVIAEAIEAAASDPTPGTTPAASPSPAAEPPEASIPQQATKEPSSDVPATPEPKTPPTGQTTPAGDPTFYAIPPEIIAEAQRLAHEEGRQ